MRRTDAMRRQRVLPFFACSVVQRRGRKTGKTAENRVTHNSLACVTQWVGFGMNEKVDPYRPEPKECGPVVLTVRVMVV